jgi:hypothetical protein
MSRILVSLALSCLMAFAVALPDVSAAGGAKGGGESKSASRLTSSPSYVPMTPLTASTPMGRSIGGMISAEFGLDIPDARLRARAQAMRPRLQDALRGAVTEYGASHLRPGAAPDPTQLCVMAQSAIDRTLGGPGARVLISNVMVVAR